MKDLGPDHWENLYLEGRVHWHAGGVPVEFENYLAREATPGRALGENFQLVDSRQTKDPKPVFHDKEYWQVWSRSEV